MSRGNSLGAIYIWKLVIYMIIILSEGWGRPARLADSHEAIRPRPDNSKHSDCSQDSLESRTSPAKVKKGRGVHVCVYVHAARESRIFPGDIPARPSA